MEMCFLFFGAGFVLAARFVSFCHASRPAGAYSLTATNAFSCPYSREVKKDLVRPRLRGDANGRLRVPSRDNSLLFWSKSVTTRIDQGVHV